MDRFKSYFLIGDYSKKIRVINPYVYFLVLKDEMVYRGNKIKKFFYPVYPEDKYYSFHKYFKDHKTRRIRYSLPFVRMFERVWFAIPMYILYKNRQNIEYRVIKTPTKTIINNGVPFLRLFVEIEECEMMSWNWLKHINYVKP